MSGEDDSARKEELNKEDTRTPRERVLGMAQAARNLFEPNKRMAVFGLIKERLRPSLAQVTQGQDPELCCTIFEIIDAAYSDPDEYRRLWTAVGLERNAITPAHFIAAHAATGFKYISRIETLLREPAAERLLTEPVDAPMHQRLAALLNDPDYGLPAPELRTFLGLNSALKKDRLQVELMEAQIEEEKRANEEQKRANELAKAEQAKRDKQDRQAKQDRRALIEEQKRANRLHERANELREQANELAQSTLDTAQATSVASTQATDGAVSKKLSRDEMWKAALGFAEIRPGWGQRALWKAWNDQPDNPKIPYRYFPSLGRGRPPRLKG
jgi:hypothetical protein